MVGPNRSSTDARTTCDTWLLARLFPGFEKAWAFLNHRNEVVIKIQKTKAQLGNLAEKLPFVGRFSECGINAALAANLRFSSTHDQKELVWFPRDLL